MHHLRLCIVSFARLLVIGAVLHLFAFSILFRIFFRIFFCILLVVFSRLPFLQSKEEYATIIGPSQITLGRNTKSVRECVMRFAVEDLFDHIAVKT